MSRGISQDKTIIAWERIVSIIERALAAGDEAADGEDDTIRVPLGRFLLSQMFHRVKPALSKGWLERDPVHLVMFGATNSGKSTVLNLLLGKISAPTDSKARSTQHSTAFRSSSMGNRFVDDFPTRFPNYHRYLNEYPEKQSDGELRTGGYRPCFVIYDPDESPGRSLAAPVAESAVFWDTPDFSTEEAQIYMSAVLDTAAMGDIVILTVTRENYADHRGLLLLDMIRKTGVPVLVIANKLEDDTSLLDDIKGKLYSGKPEKSGRRKKEFEIYPLPYVRGSDDDERTRLLSEHAGASVLREASAEYIASGPRLKKRVLKGCSEFIEQSLDDVLKPLRTEIDLEESWAAAVDKITEAEFYSRYWSDYLGREDYEQYGDFNLAVIKWLDLLEIPGIGRFVSRAAGVARLPFRWVKKGIRKILTDDDQPVKTKEEEVVYDSYQRWIRALIAEAQRRGERFDNTAQVKLEQKLGSDIFRSELEENFSRAYVSHRKTMKVLIEQVAYSLAEYVEKRPSVRKALQGSKFLLDSVATIGVVATGGLDWTDLVVAPMVAPVVRLVLELAGQGFMEIQKRALKENQFRSMRKAFNDYMVEPVKTGLEVSVTRDEFESVTGDFAVLKKALAEISRA